MRLCKTQATSKYKMQIEQTENELIIRETPGCLWLFGLFFAIIGGLFVYGALGGFVNSGSQPPWVLSLAFVFGSIGVITGASIIYNAPITKLIVNRFDGRVFMIRYGLFGRREDFFRLDDIEHFYAIEDTDTDGDKIWTLGMKLIDDEEIIISSQSSHDEDFVRNFVFVTNEFCGKQISPTEMILEGEDESDAEMR